MNVQDIIDEFGAFYLGTNNQENASRLFSELYSPYLTADLFREMPTDATSWRASEVLMGNIVQPFQISFTPKDPLSFIPKVIDLYRMKVDLQEEPDKLVNSWLGFLTTQERVQGGLDRSKWPFVRWWIENHIIPKLKENMEENEIYFGRFAAPTPGTAGPDGTSMDGIGKKLDDYIDDGLIVPITTGALETDSKLFVKQVEDFVKQVYGLYKKYAGKPMDLCMNTFNAQRYKNGYRELYGIHTDFDAKGNQIVIDTKVSIVGLGSMDSNPHNDGAASDRLWLSMRDNRVRPTKQAGNINLFEVEKVDRKVKLYTDWHEVVDFILPQAVFVNDVQDVEEEEES